VVALRKLSRRHTIENLALRQRVVDVQRRRRAAGGGVGFPPAIEVVER